MSGRGDEQAELAVLQALKAGPLDIRGLLAALRGPLSAYLPGQEGGLHALLLRLVRRAQVEVAGQGEQGLARYALPGVVVSGGAEDASFEPAKEPALARTALRAVSGVRDPATRGRVQSDILAHLEALPARQADFGSPRALRTLLYRVDRGRPAVCLTAAGSDHLRRFVLHEGPWIAGAALLWVVLKLFVLQTFVIPSESMVPALLVGDRVLVFRFAEGEAPERFSITTFEGDTKTYVKRLIGLPGERIALLHGDVYINGELLVKPDEIREALRARLGDFDLRAMSHPPGWTAATRDGGKTRVWRSGLLPAYRAGLRAEAGRDFALRDGYAEVDCAPSSGGPVELSLVRGPSERLDGGTPEGTTEWTLRLGSAGASLVEIRRGPGAAEPEEETLFEDAAVTAKGAQHLSLSYVDGVLRAQVGAASWSGARPAVDGPLEIVLALPAEDSGPLRLRVDRDIHYAHMGDRAVPAVGPGFRGRLNDHAIPPGHLFFLGDNTTNSTDSRFGEHMGDVPVSQVVGPVSIRIWPPARWGSVK